MKCLVVEDDFIFCQFCYAMQNEDRDVPLEVVSTVDGKCDVCGEECNVESE